MNHAKNCAKLPKFVKVTAKILPVLFYPDTVYQKDVAKLNNTKLQIITI